MSREPLKGRDYYRVWREIGTRWNDMDPYGHVNNAVHYQWFDTAVNTWLIEADLLDIERGDPIGLVVETGCRYASVIAYPQPVEIGMAIDAIGRSSIVYRLGVFLKNRSEASAEGRFTHVYVDRATRRPRDLPPKWRETFQSLLSGNHL